MTEIPPVSDTEKQSSIRPLIERCDWRGTPGSKFMELLGHRPEIARTFLDNWEASFYGGTIEHTTKELVRLHLASLHECEYCSSVGSNKAIEQGLTDEKVRKLADFETDSAFSDRERAALRFAEAFFHDRHEYDELRGYFDEGEIMELVWFVGLQDAGEKVVSSLGLKTGSCDIVPGDVATSQ